MKYQYWLSNIEGIGPAAIGKLLNYVESAEELYFLSEELINAMEEPGEKERSYLLKSKKKWDLDGEWERFLEKGISFVSKEMDTFPEKLRYIHNPPYSIYFKGELPDEHRYAVAIVGARRCSEYGRCMAEKLGEKLAKQ